MRSDFITLSMIAIDGSGMTWMAPSGAPASSAALARSRAASAEQALAMGCGEITIALRVSAEIITL